MCLEIFPLSNVVKFLWNFEPETSNFERCYLSNLLDAADMVWYDRGRGSQNARDKLTTHICLQLERLTPREARITDGDARCIAVSKASLPVQIKQMMGKILHGFFKKKWACLFSNVLQFSHTIQNYTKFANFARLYFPYFKTFCNQTLQVRCGEVCTSWDRFAPPLRNFCTSLKVVHLPLGKFQWWNKVKCDGCLGSTLRDVRKFSL
jgi:hypothetical protein